MPVQRYLWTGCDSVRRTPVGSNRCGDREKRAAAGRAQKFDEKTNGSVEMPQKVVLDDCQLFTLNIRRIEEICREILRMMVERDK